MACGSKRQRGVLVSKFGYAGCSLPQVTRESGGGVPQSVPAVFQCRKVLSASEGSKQVCVCAVCVCVLCAVSTG